MAILEIIKEPHIVLHRKAKPVTDFGPELQQLIDDMVETMRDAPGVGLAGPQVHQLLRVIVVEFGDEEDENAPKKLYTLVNPEITRMSKETVKGIEGCLSIPELLGDVSRSVSVTIKAQTRHGQVTKIKASGWLARIFQHEIDHTNGILFTDRTEDVFRIDELMDEENPAGTAFEESSPGAPADLTTSID